MECDVTYEDVAGFVADELDAARMAEIGEHIPQCQRCRERIVRLEQTDAALGHLQRTAPSAAAVLTARRAIGEVTRGTGKGDIMTLEEVGEFLRITPAELGEIAEELPAFELAGRIRVRRERLCEWIQQREQDYARATAARWASRAS